MSQTTGEMQRQIDATNRLWLEAQNQTAEAKTANTIARAASQSVQRAFIVVDRLEVEKELLPDGSIGTWIINPVVTNSGSTPTKNLYFSINFGDAQMFHWPPEKEPPFDAPSFPGIGEIQAHKGWQRSAIGPHATVTNLTVLNGFTASSFVPKGIPWTNTGQFVFGAFVYGDVFNPIPKHITEFCFVLDRPSMVSNQFLPYERCKHHNCADDECKAETP